MHRNPLKILEDIGKPEKQRRQYSEETNIKRNKINREMMEVCADGGRLAIRLNVQTVYDLGKNKKLSLVKCEIETETHQIRAC